MCWIIYSSQNGIDRSVGNFSELILKIGLFELLDLVEHIHGSVMEVSFSTKFRVSKEVNESSLLDIFVFFVNSVVLKLFFGVSQMLILNHLSSISPLVGELSVFIARVHIIEN